MKIKDIFGNWIVKNVLLAIVIISAFVLAVNVLLGVATRHGKSIPVPDFTNMSLSEARSAADAAGIRILVTDSVYVRRMTPGAVYMQTPAPGTGVKKGRKIRLVTNTVMPSEVYMPALVGCSLRQAKAELQRNGLVLGRLTYVRDIATNYVLRQLRYGVDVAPYTPMSSGTVINLVLGLSDDNMAVVPDVTGKQYRNAVDVLHDNSLNVGKLRFDASVKDYSDSLNAVVYSQSPKLSAESVLKGTDVSLYLTVNPEKMPASARPKTK